MNITLDRLIASEVAYTRMRAEIIGRWPDNCFGVALRQEGAALGFQVKSVPTPWLNRVMGRLTPAEVPAWAAWFRAAGVRGRFELLPDRDPPALTEALLAAGLRPAGGDTIVAATPQITAAPKDIWQAKSEAEVEQFLDTHLEGLGLPEAIRDGAKGNMRGWRGLPGWNLLIAMRDGEPAGTCVLFIEAGVAYIADMATRTIFRQRGVQTDLLAQCHLLSKDCDIIWARCAFQSGSHRNILRSGLRTLCTTSFWQ